MYRRKILIYALGGNGIGLGHYYRAQALRDELERRGHSVKLATNLGGRRNLFVSGPPGTARDTRLSDLFAKFWPDIIIFDLRERLPGGVSEFCWSFGIRVVSLLDEEGVDLSYPQDHASRVILRPELFQRGPIQGRGWLVFGGSEDPISLLPYFSKYSAEKNTCYLVGPGSQQVLPENYTWMPLPGERFLELVLGCEKACISFGMVAWELAACGKPQYIFSLDQEHLRTALTLEEYGLARVWPQVGLPGPEEFRDFLHLPAIPWGQRPDNRGAQRLIQKLESL